MLSALAVLFVGAFFASVAFTELCRRYADAKKLFDSHGSRGHIKPFVRKIPNIGGIAIFWAIVLPVAAGLLLVSIPDQSVAKSLDGIAKHLPGMRQQMPLALTMLGSMFVLHTVGLIDDRRPLNPFVKLGVMALATLAVVLPFRDMRLLTMLDAYVGGSWLSLLVTILWFLAVTNAMNFIDNMDGLCASVATVAASFFLVTAFLNAQWFIAMMLVLLIGALLGFLVFNFPRPGGALIFMGDGGSLIVGFLLAFLTVRTTYFTDPAHALPGAISTPNSGAWYAVFMPLCVLAVPLYDLSSVTLIRLSQGKSPFVGDQQHFSHRLRARGLSVLRTLGVICGCTALTGIGGILLGRVQGWVAALIAAQTMLILVLLALYEHGSLVHRRGAEHAGRKQP